MLYSIGIREYVYSIERGILFHDGPEDLFSGDIYVEIFYCDLPAPSGGPFFTRVTYRQTSFLVYSENAENCAHRFNKKNKNNNIYAKSMAAAVLCFNRLYGRFVTDNRVRVLHVIRGKQFSPPPPPRIRNSRVFFVYIYIRQAYVFLTVLAR